jgi:hypothetical protein
MSSRRAGLKRGSVTQHRPHNIDPPASERDQSLGVPFAFGPLAIVEGPGLRGAAQTGKCRLVEDPLWGLVPSSHSAVVTHPLARITGGGHQSSVGGEPVGTLEGAEVSHTDQELLGPEDRPHVRQANENPSLRTGEKTPPNLLVESGDALLEAEDVLSELDDDARGYLLCG